MKIAHPRAALGAMLFCTLVFVAAAHAAPVSTCNAAKKKCIGKYVAAALSCHAKAEQKGLAVDAGCLAKAASKVTGGGRGCFDKAEAKAPNDCAALGDAASQLGAADDVIAEIVTAVDPSYPTPTLTRCGAARKKCAGKKAAGLMGCSAKSNKDGVGDPACAPRIRDKFAGAYGCDVKALQKGPDCLGATSTAALESAVDVWQEFAVYHLDGIIPADCGNGVVGPDEQCDPAAAPGIGDCAGGYSCSAACTCSCPSSVHLVGDPTSPESVLDLGWTGAAHRMPIVSAPDVTLAVSHCSGIAAPCGTCELSGPLPNPGATDLHNQRCSNDTSVRCADDAPCLGGGGTCALYASPPLPASAAGISTCSVFRFSGPISGTLSVGAGSVAYRGAVEVAVSEGSGPDVPCVTCVGDATMNDDVQGGTCTSGPRVGLACDANGVVPGRPDFGVVSLDCPSDPGDLLKEVQIEIGGASETVTKTVTAASPQCSGELPGTRCLCDTCNNVDAHPCSSNADCPDSPGPLPGICGGPRCIGGANGGSGCGVASECPGGSCGRPGEPTKPAVCLDDEAVANMVDCTDTAPVDGEGECVAGPVRKTCSGPHAQRSCSIDADCAPGMCQAYNAPCFLTGGLMFKRGTDTLVAEGAPSPPVGNVSEPTLGAVFCVPPVDAAIVDVTAGLPGPARLTTKITMTTFP